MKDIYIVIPALEPERKLCGHIEKLLDKAPFQIIVINDGLDDRYRSVLIVSVTVNDTINHTVVFKCQDKKDGLMRYIGLYNGAATGSAVSAAANRFLRIRPIQDKVVCDTILFFGFYEAQKNRMFSEKERIDK